MKWLIIYFRYFLLLLLIATILGCTKPQPVRLPPVTEGWHQKAALRNGYIVQKRDTLYSIAWAFGMDYRDLAVINKLKPPYILHPGQRLHLSPISGYTRKSININGRETKFSYGYSKIIKYLRGWVWPTSGRIATNFNNKFGGNKGVDIAGLYGQKILASNSGRVVYNGTGIRSYGKLIIIKHNDNYLSAYAYNKDVFIREGEEVRVGQKIATMGYDSEGHPRLHFEIRRFGEPVDPSLCLPKKL